MDVVRKVPHQGWIEVVTGSMFSGKSEELIRRVRRAEIARQKVQVFKPRLDDRFSQDYVVSHSDIRFAAQNVASARELLEAVKPDTEVVAIDEGQFFDQELPMICSSLADSGRRVIVAGLDQDYLGKPFEPMPQLLAIAEYITKTLAICMVCGNPANHTQRLVAQPRTRAAGRRGRLRGALPALLRSDAVESRVGRTPRHDLEVRSTQPGRSKPSGIYSDDTHRGYIEPEAIVFAPEA